MKLAVFVIPALMMGGTVLDGVYTPTQAKRGQTGYQTNCSSCHRADLTGFSGPPLKDALFMERWREFNVDILLSLIRTTMPLNNAGSLNEAAYLDILAYILQANSLPAGSKELTAGVAAKTLLVGKEGPQPLPSSAHVEVVGCFTEDSGNGWFVTSASEPLRTLDAYSLTAEEVIDAKLRPLGALVFRLEDFREIPGFNPEASLGNKVDAKGILVRQPKGNRINVTAIQTVSATCER